VGYQGLADANLRLLDLIEASADIGTVNELLDAEMRLADFVLLTAEALSNQPDAPVATVETLRAIRAGIDGDLMFKLGDLLDITTANPEAAADTSLNVFDLLVMSAQVANGKNAVAIPKLSVDIPNVAGISATLYLIEPPQIAIGPAGKDADGDWKTEVKTAQVKLGVHMDLANLPLGVATAGLDLYVEAAQTTAWLDSIQCPRAVEPNGMVTVGAQPGIARVGIGQLGPGGEVTGPANVAKVTLPGIIPVVVAVTAQANVPLVSDLQSPIDFPGPFPSEQQMVDTALSHALTNGLDGLASKPGLLHIDPCLPLVCETVENALLEILRPVIQALGEEALTPLLEALGITLGGADLQVFTLVNTQPQLVR
jgi:Predicted membrane protein